MKTFQDLLETVTVKTEQVNFGGGIGGACDCCPPRLVNRYIAIDGESNVAFGYSHDNAIDEYKKDFTFTAYRGFYLRVPVEVREYANRLLLTYADGGISDWATKEDVTRVSDTDEAWWDMWHSGIALGIEL